MYEPMVVRESAPTTTPPSNWTAMIDVYAHISKPIVLPLHSAH
jgi:hypothetical protein